jgi:exopolysaccharide biosynthesis polyprenyl glycosylphosphotransferase
MVRMRAGRYGIAFLDGVWAREGRRGMTALGATVETNNGSALDGPRRVGAVLEGAETKGHAESVGATVAETSDGTRSRLRALLVGLDALGVTSVWALAVLWSSSQHPDAWGRAATQIVFVLAVSAFTVGALATERLYQSRVCAIRTVEIARLARVAILSGAVAIVVGNALGVHLSTRLTIVAPACTLLTLATLRQAYTLWLRACRARGRFARDVVVIGTNDEANELCRLLQTQPELGYRVRGVVGNQQDWDARGSDIPWIDEATAAVAATRRLDAGALVAITAVSPDEANRVVRGLLAEGVHVQTSSGITNLGHRRLRAVPMSHEALYYVEASTHPRWQEIAKRVMDLAIAFVALLASAPLILAAAIAILVEDRKSVLFRQERVGLHGRPFQVLKLRTMSVDAATQRDHLEVLNERRDGPLFKASADPRVTRVGRFLRATSIDELPQLVNVIKGDMSLVGPRPALREEVDEFDQEHLSRLNMRPGVTGLWQVEARDNPSFHVYRRLDLFYIENWSLRMDATILFGTVSALLGRAVQLGCSVVSRAIRRGRLGSNRAKATEISSIS